MLQLQATGELTENNLFVISSVILLISKPLRKRNLGKESKFGTFSRDRLALGVLQHLRARLHSWASRQMLSEAKKTKTKAKNTPVDCWQSVFLSHLNRGHETRRFGWGGRRTRYEGGWHAFFPTQPYRPCPAFFPTRTPPYFPFAFSMTKHSSGSSVYVIYYIAVVI